MSPRAEALIAAADRAQHIDEVVRPALDAGRTVVSDRSVYSTLAYQGYGRELDVDMVRSINEWATDGLWPDVVVFLDTPDDVIAERMSRRDLDRFEAAGDAFHDRVIQGLPHDGRRRSRPMGHRRRGRVDRRGRRPRSMLRSPSETPR